MCCSCKTNNWLAWILVNSSRLLGFTDKEMLQLKHKLPVSTKFIFFLPWISCQAIFLSVDMLYTGSSQKWIWFDSMLGNIIQEKLTGITYDVNIIKSALDNDYLHTNMSSMYSPQFHQTASTVDEYSTKLWSCKLYKLSMRESDGVFWSPKRLFKPPSLCADEVFSDNQFEVFTQRDLKSRSFFQYRTFCKPLALRI